MTPRSGKTAMARVTMAELAKSRPGTITRVLLVDPRGEREIVLGPNGKPVIDVREQRAIASVPGEGKRG